MNTLHTEQCSVRIRASKQPSMLSSPVKVADGTQSGFRLRGVFHFKQKKNQ